MHEIDQFGSDFRTNFQTIPSALTPLQRDQEFMDCVVEAVWIELNKTLIPAALLTSTLNAIVCHKSTSRFEELPPFIPGYLVLIGAITRRVVDTDFNGRTLGIFQSLLDKINLGNTLVRRYKFRADDGGSQSWSELEEIAKYWRSICYLGTYALRDLGRYVNQSFFSVRFETELIELLENASNGGSPYAAHDGRVQFPSWADRRKLERNAVNMTVRIVSCGTVWKTTMVNISRRGLMVDRVFGLRVGATATVELHGGRMLNGAVAWTMAGRAGIAVRPMLEANDPLLLDTVPGTDRRT